MRLSTGVTPPILTRTSLQTPTESLPVVGIRPGIGTLMKDDGLGGLKKATVVYDGLLGRHVCGLRPMNLLFLCND